MGQTFGAVDGNDSLSTRILELRKKGDYARAVAMAQGALRVLDPGIPAYQRTGLERVVADLRFEETLGAEGKRKLRLSSIEGARQDSCYGAVDYRGAAEAGRRELALLRDVLGPRHPTIAVCLGNLADCLAELGDLAEAESLCVQSLQLRREVFGPDHPYVVAQLSNLAGVYSSESRFREAESASRQAMQAARRLPGDNREMIADLCNNLAVLRQNMGDYVEADQLYRESLAIRRLYLPPDDLLIAQSLGNLGHLCSLRGDYAQAEALAREAVAIRRKVLGPEHPALALGLSNLAVVLRKDGRAEEAEPIAREALRIRQKTLGPEHADVALSLNNLAVLLASRGEYQEVESLHRSALAIRRKVFGDDNTQVAETLANLAWLHRRQGRMREAEAGYTDALQMRRRCLGASHPFVAETLIDLGQTYRAAGDVRRARATLAEAARVYEEARVRVGTGLSRATFLESPYPDLAAAELDLDHPAEAWVALENSLSRVLAEFLASAEHRSLTPREASREDSLRSVLEELESRVRELGGADPAPASAGDGSAPLARLQADLAVAQSDWAGFEREIQAKYPVTEGRAFPLPRIQASLAANQAIVGWLDVVREGKPDDSWGYVIRSTGPVRWTRLAATKDNPGGLRDDIRLSGSSVLGAPSRFAESAQAQALWKRRFEPLAKDLPGVDQITVVAAGKMLSFPLEVLIDEEGKFLADRYSVSYTPSATIRTWLEEESARRRETGTRPVAGPALLVGDPPIRDSDLAEMADATGGSDSGERKPGRARFAWSLSWNRSALAGNRDSLQGLPRLAWSRSEIQGLATLFDQPTVLLGSDASEQKLGELAGSGALSRFSVVHVASHVLIDSDRPERSAIVLSQVGLPDARGAAIEGRRIWDGLVTAQEIVNHWRLNADLVTLSACQSAMGKQVAGEGYIGLAHALVQAGARSLVVSLWEVDDRTTSLLMTRFYQNWIGKAEGNTSGQSMGKAEALRDAKAWLRTYTDGSGKTPYSHPYYWSSFILIGDTE